MGVVVDDVDLVLLIPILGRLGTPASSHGNSADVGGSHSSYETGDDRRNAWQRQKHQVVASMSPEQATGRQASNTSTAGFGQETNSTC